MLTKPRHICSQKHNQTSSKAPSPIVPEASSLLDVPWYTIFARLGIKKGLERPLRASALTVCVASHTQQCVLCWTPWNRKTRSGKRKY
ncbi:hypothetical protein Naga_100041g21 [Nannochloropsis gaditana]|uniref:Uncharacterized protein n=1 Tax=Nannochloropsis gaditana TaxID=72520 RepID=W7T241_9STRA|nr:hypothetical protein Naga_100041g21 [Nannochloropsis gaditana]